MGPRQFLLFGALFVVALLIFGYRVLAGARTSKKPVGSADLPPDKDRTLSSTFLLSQLVQDLRGSENPLLQTLTFKQYVQLTKKDEMIDAASQMARLLKLKGGGDRTGRIFLSAFLISYYHQEMFETDASNAGELVLLAKKLLRSIDELLAVAGSSLAVKEGRMVAVRVYFRLFCRKYLSFDVANGQPLLVVLMSNYVQFERERRNLLTLDLPPSKTSKILELKAVVKAQAGIRSKIASIGGAAALEQAKATMGQIFPKAVQYKVDDIYALQFIPDMVMVHELCFGTMFEPFDLIADYAPSLFDHDLLALSNEDFCEHLCDILRPIVNAQQQEMLAKVGKHKTKGDGNMRHVFTKIINIAAASCTPVRDADVAECRKGILSILDIKQVKSMMLLLLEVMRIDYVSYDLVTTQRRPILLNSLVSSEQQFFSQFPYTATSLFIIEHPNWTEWIFTPEAMAIESMLFDGKRLQRWRTTLATLTAGLGGGSAKFRARLGKLLGEEQLPGRDAVKKEMRMTDEHALDIMVETITELFHFRNLHFAIHRQRYQECALG